LDSRDDQRTSAADEAAAESSRYGGEKVEVIARRPAKPAEENKSDSKFSSSMLMIGLTPRPMATPRLEVKTVPAPVPTATPTPKPEPPAEPSVTPTPSPTPRGETSIFSDLSKVPPVTIIKRGGEPKPGVEKPSLEDVSVIPKP
jgi:hypothetical protein